MNGNFAFYANTASGATVTTRRGAGRRRLYRDGAMSMALQRSYSRTNSACLRRARLRFSVWSLSRSVDDITTPR